MKFRLTRLARPAVGIAALVTLLVLPAWTKDGQNVNVQRPLTGSFTNPCNGEQFSLEGTTHFLLDVRQDRDGGDHFTGHTNSRGNGATASGVRYVVNGTSNVTENSREDGSTSGSVGHFHVNRQGSDVPDFYGSFHFHVTRGADGQPTAEIDDVGLACR